MDNNSYEVKVYWNEYTYWAERVLNNVINGTELETEARTHC
jgi:hypothetical protein